MIQQIHSLILSFGQFNSFHLSSVLCRSWELEESSAIRFSRRAKMALAERDGAPGWHSLPRDTPTTSHASDAPSDFPLVHAKPSPVPLCYNLSYLCHVWQKKTKKHQHTSHSLPKPIHIITQVIPVRSACASRTITWCITVYLSQGGCSFD